MCIWEEAQPTSVSKWYYGKALEKFGSRFYLSVKDEGYEDVLFVRLQHNVRDSGRRSRQGNFKGIQGALKVFNSHVNNSPIVIVEEKMFGIKIAILLRKNVVIFQEIRSKNPCLPLN